MSSPYSIAIALSMSSNHNAVLGALSKGLLGVDANVSKLTKNFGGLKTAIGLALGAFAVETVIAGMVKLVDVTKSYSAELTKLKNLGGDMATAVANGTIENRAFDISKRVPMNVVDLFKIQGQSNSILGADDGMKVWEDLAKFSWVMQNQKDFKGDATEDLGKFLRAGELGGRLTDPNTHKAAVEELEKYLDLSQKIMAATHGMVSPQTLLGMAQQGGFSMRGMTDEGFMNMAIAAQAMGGPRAGTALLSLYNQIGTGTMTQRAARGLTDLGLLQDGEWSTVRGGGVKVDPTALQRNQKLLGGNPMAFVDAIYAQLEARGIKDPQEQQRLVAAAMSRQTSERFAIEGMMNRDQIAAERGRMGQGAGFGDAFSNFNAQSVEANIEGLKNSWQNLLYAVAGPQSQNEIAVMQSLTSAINGITDSFRTADGAVHFVDRIGQFIKDMTGGAATSMLSGLGAPGWLMAAAFNIGKQSFELIWAGLTQAWSAGYQGVAATFAALGQQLTSQFMPIISAVSGFIDMIAKLYSRIESFLGGKAMAPKDGVFPGGTKATPGAFHSYVPKVVQQPQNISLRVELDGRTLGEAVSEQVASLMNFPTGAPASDGLSRWHDADHNAYGT